MKTYAYMHVKFLKDIHKVKNIESLDRTFSKI